MDFGSNEEKMAMKQYIVSLLIKQAIADNDFSNIEKKYLAYASRKLGLDNTQIAAIRQDPDAFTIAPPPDESMRMTIMYYLLFMMRADGQVEQEEEVLCHKVGFQLGFRQEMVTNLIGLMKEYLRDDIPPNGMLEKIKPYLN